MSTMYIRKPSWEQDWIKDRPDPGINISRKAGMTTKHNHETPLHIFHEYNAVKCSQADLVQCFQNNLMLPTLTPQTAILGISESVSKDSNFKNKVFINHILLVFKLYVFKSREKKFTNINNLIAEIRKVKTLEKEIALTNSMKTIAFTKKWLMINKISP